MRVMNAGAKRWPTRIVVCAIAAVATLVLVGCALPSSGAPGGGVDDVEIDDGSSDQLFSDTVAGETFYVFQYGNETFTVKDPTIVDVSGVEPLEDGKFYKVVADVTYLNGGVAGYYNYPQIESVYSCEEISPLDIGLPSIEDKYYGVTLVGDYADGDVFFYGITVQALWKDGSWVYSYNDEIELDDDTTVCCRAGVSEDEIRAGMAEGVLSCEDYFVLPPLSE